MIKKKLRFSNIHFLLSIYSSHCHFHILLFQKKNPQFEKRREKLILDSLFFYAPPSPGFKISFSALGTIFLGDLIFLLFSAKKIF